MEAAAPPPPAAPQPAPGPARGQPISVGKVIGDAFSLYGSNFLPLIGVGFVIFFLFGIVTGFLTDEGGFVLQFIATILELIATAIYTGFVVKLVQDVRDGRRDSTVGELISAAMPAIGGLIIFGLLFGLGVGIGLILLIIPGLYLMTIWAVGSPAIVVERRGVIEAFGRSHELVKGQAWTVFGVIVCVFLIRIAAVLIAAAIGGAIGGVAGAIIVGILVLALFAPIQALTSSVLFFELGGGGAPAGDDGQTVVEY